MSTQPSVVNIPYSEESERAVIGSVLLDPATFEELRGILRDSDFFLARHGAIWQACQKLAASGQPCDAILIAEQLRQDRKLDDIGGRSYLLQLSTEIGTSAYAEVYARLVKQASVRRQALQAADKIRQAASDESMPLEDVLSRVDVAVKSVLVNTSANTVYDMHDLASTALDRMERAAQLRRSGQVLLAGISYGFQDVDRYLMGAQKGQYIIACGRPGMGKSVFAVQVAYHFAQSGKRIRFFSTEMTQDEVFDRLVTIHTGIPYYVHRSGMMTDQQMRQYTQAAGELSKLPIVIDSESLARPSYIWRESVKQSDSQSGLDAIIVDGTYRLQTDDKHSSLYERGNEIATAMKNLARKLQVPLIGTHQIGRDGDTRPPILRDLQESGRYEQEADIVLGMWRDNNADPNNQQVHILKHRNGATGIINLYFDAPLMRFRDAVSYHVDLLE